MKKTLIDKETIDIDINKIYEHSKIEIIEKKQGEIEKKQREIEMKKKYNYKEVSEYLNQEQKLGPFTVNITHKHKNRWIVNCKNNYEILFCTNNNPESVVKLHKINKGYESCIHKKESGCYYLNNNDHIYIIFYPGFPNGGECWADINAGGHFNHCRDLPKNGAIILKTSLIEKFIKPVLLQSLTNIKENILAFDLFSGVGFYNQLFSLETAIYMAKISNRYLILNIKHPLVTAGRMNKDCGLITDYLSDDFKKLLIGFEIRAYKNFIDPMEYEMPLPSKISNIVIIDKELNISKNQTDIKYFSHYRSILIDNCIRDLFNTKLKVVYFNKSNASRIFYNFYTTPKKYDVMNKIALTVSGYNNFLTNICNKLTFDKHFISVHIRAGDWHKSINHNVNKIRFTNLLNWLEKNGNGRPIYMMTDKKDNPLIKMLHKYKLVFTDELITENIKNELKQHYKNITVADFLLQKYILEQGDIFFGTQGSTATVHLNYKRYINNKSYEHYTHSNNNLFDKTIMTYKKKNDKYYWKKINFSGGHPLSWSHFFPDNIKKKTDILRTERTEYIKDADPFWSIDSWLPKVDLIIDTKQKCCIKPKKKTIVLKTDLLFDYIDVLNQIKFPFILITTSNDDHCPPHLNYRLNNKTNQNINKLLSSKYLILWLAKNPSIIHKKIKPFPIGPKWQWKTTRFHGENKAEHLRIYNKYCLNPNKNMRNKKLKQKLLYLNFNQTTNNPLYEPHKNIRHKAKSDLLKNGFKWNQSEPFENYMQTLSLYKFCVAPPGRGIDSHRCWEALMVGTIPIVINSTINELYEDLPVIIVNSWDVITVKFLNKKYDEMMKTSYNFEKVYSEYWLRKLQEYQ